MTPCPFFPLRRSFRAFTASLAWLLLLAGCQSSSHAVTYYGLSSMAAQDQQNELATGRTDLSIGIGMVVLPDYLDRPQIVTRKGPNQLSIDEFHRWAGQLNKEIERVLTENLIQITGSQRVVHLPWRRDFVPDRTVGITIYAFERVAGGGVRLAATVTVTDEQSRKETRTWTFDRQAPVKNSSYAEMVAAQSMLLVDLCRQIADTIK